MSYQHFERLYDFSGGLNNRDADALLQNNESPDMCNIILGKRGTFETRPGTIRFRNDPVEKGRPVTSVFEYVREGDSHFLAFAGDKLKRAIPGGWEELTESDGSAGFTKDTRLEFAVNSVINKALFVNGADGYFETDGEAFEEVEPYEPDSTELQETGDCAIPEEPALICYHGYRVWLANVKGYPDRVYFSVDDKQGNTLYNYFNASWWLRSSNPRGEGITALVSFKGQLYIFTRSTIKLVLGTERDDMQIVDIFQSVGAVSQRSVCTFGSYIIFEGVDGVYIFDGVNAPMKISVRIPVNFEKVAVDYRHLSCGAIHQGKYFLSVPWSTVNDATLVYDTEVIPMTYIGDKHSYANSPWVLQRGYIPTQWVVGYDLNLYFGASDGYVYQYGIGDTDAGRMIDAYYTTKLMDLQMPDRAKRFRRLYLDARRDQDSFIQIEFRTSEDDKWTIFNEEIDMYKHPEHMFFRFPNVRGPLCRKIAFRFSNIYTGSKFQVNGFTLDVAVHGHQEERS